MRWLPVLLLAACNPYPVNVCLSVPQYDRVTQTRAALELAALPSTSVLARLVEDYGDLRARMRSACS